MNNEILAAIRILERQRREPITVKEVPLLRDNEKVYYDSVNNIMLVTDMVHFLLTCPMGTFDDNLKLALDWIRVNRWKALEKKFDKECAALSAKWQKLIDAL